MPIDRRSFMLATLAAGLAGGRLHAEETLAELTGKLALKGEDLSVAVATIRDGQVAEAFSAASEGKAAPGEGVYQAASLSKPLVAFITLKMVGRGELALDTPLDRWLPDGYPHRQNIFALKAAPVVDVVPMETLRKITPRMLLSHTAGFANWSPEAPLVPEITPGSRWQYSGEGYVLLQHLLETVSGRPLQALAERELFGPAGMRSSAFRLTEAIAPRLVAGSPGQLKFPREIAASSLYTTAGDYARFLETLLNDSALLSLTLDNPLALPASWHRFWQSSGLAWGLGWGLEIREKPVSLWHWGSNPGFRSLVLTDLGTRNGVIVLTSSEKGMSAAKTIVASAIPGEHPALEFGMVN